MHLNIGSGEQARAIPVIQLHKNVQYEKGMNIQIN